MRTLNMEPAKLYDIIDMQADYWGKDFPRIKEMQKRNHRNAQGRRRKIRGNSQTRRRHG